MDILYTWTTPLVEATPLLIFIAVLGLVSFAGACVCGLEEFGGGVAVSILLLFFCILSIALFHDDPAFIKTIGSTDHIKGIVTDVGVLNKLLDNYEIVNSEGKIIELELKRPNEK